MLFIKKQELHNKMNFDINAVDKEDFSGVDYFLTLRFPERFLDVKISEKEYIELKKEKEDLK